MSSVAWITERLRLSTRGDDEIVDLTERVQAGTWPQVILVDFDVRPRQREVVVQLTGEKRS